MTETQVFPLNSEASNELELQLPCGYHIHNNQISINVSAIHNNRNVDNISGTLALELWALRQPYSNEQFDGVALAQVAIGQILGQHFVGPCVYDLQYHEPPTEQWHLCLMLREWTENGYVTCDAVNFDLPYNASCEPSINGDGDNKVVDVDFACADLDQASVSHQSDVKSEVETTDDLDIAAETELKEMTPIQKPGLKTSSKKSSAGKTKRPSAPKKVAKVSKSSVVSINKAALEQIRAIKGLSAAVAQNILANRPYKKLDDLLKVKGLGPKLLDKIKDQIKL